LVLRYNNLTEIVLIAVWQITNKMLNTLRVPIIAKFAQRAERCWRNFLGYLRLRSAEHHRRRTHRKRLRFLRRHFPAQGPHRIVYAQHIADSARDLPRHRRSVGD
jgi:hypothetical protein